MNIIAKKEVQHKGNTYVFVVYDDNTYEIFLIQNFHNRFPNQKSGNYGSISNSNMNEMMDSIGRNSNEETGIIDKIKGCFITIIGILIILGILTYIL